jgi:hypothetical protein
MIVSFEAKMLSCATERHQHGNRFTLVPAFDPAQHAH